MDDQTENSLSPDPGTTAQVAQTAGAVNPSQPPPSNTQSPSVSNTGQPILTGIESGYFSFLLKRWWIVLLFIIAAVLSSFVSYFISIVIIVLGFGLSKSKFENSLFKAFAAANSFSFYKNVPGMAQSGMIFSLGHSQRYSDVVVGQYKSWVLNLFLYTYTIGYGKGSHTYDRAVLAVYFNTSLPAFVLRRHNKFQMLNEEGESLNRSGYTQKVELEGGFSDHFIVFIRPDTQDDVLAILTPDVMQLLLNLDKYELEMTYKGSFYVYSHGFIDKTQSLVEMYQIVGAITSKLGADALRQRDLQSMQAAQGSPVLQS